MLRSSVQEIADLNEALQRQPLYPSRRYLVPTLKSFHAYVCRGDLLSTIFLTSVYVLRTCPLVTGRVANSARSKESGYRFHFINVKRRPAAFDRSSYPSRWWLLFYSSYAAFRLWRNRRLAMNLPIPKRFRTALGSLSARRIARPATSIMNQA